jgi:hypothetical protein
MRLREEEDRSLDVIGRYLGCHPQVGSLLIEIVNASTGVVLSPRFCECLQVECAAHGVILICDECMTWGRDSIFMCRTPAYIKFRPDVIIMGKVGIGIVLVRDFNKNNVNQLNLNNRSRPVSADTPFVESTTCKGPHVDLNAVRKSPPVPDFLFAPLVEELLYYIEMGLVEFNWVVFNDQVWWQGSSLGLQNL